MGLPSIRGIRRNSGKLRKSFRSRREKLKRIGLFEALEDRRLLAVWSGDIPDGTVWTNAETHQITGTVRVPAGATLTVQAGAMVKFNIFAGFALNVEGRLLVQGTAQQPVVFTSMRDDTGPDGILGTGDDEDTNQNGPSTGFSGDWNGIQLKPGSSGHVINFAQIRFGGAL